MNVRPYWRIYTAIEGNCNDWAAPRLARRYDRANQTSRLALVAPGGPVVSLTSHGLRVASVHLTIESIGAGVLRPSRLILWLDDASLLAQLPATLVRLQARGLEVRLSGNFGPHTKYYPYVTTQAAPGVPLVTADDDILYPRHWLADLAAAYERQPELIHCHRAHVVVLDANGRIRPYMQWQPCLTRRVRPINFATGVSGVIYPPEFQAVLAREGEVFRSICPRSDDVWLHRCALRSGFGVRQLRRMSRHFPMAPATQAIALHIENTTGRLNDRQIEVTYVADDIRLMQRIAAVLPS